MCDLIWKLFSWGLEIVVAGFVCLMLGGALMKLAESVLGSDRASNFILVVTLGVFITILIYLPPDKFFSGTFMGFGDKRTDAEKREAARLDCWNQCNEKWHNDPFAQGTCQSTCDAMYK